MYLPEKEEELREFVEEWFLKKPKHGIAEEKCPPSDYAEVILMCRKNGFTYSDFRHFLHELGYFADAIQQMESL